MDVVYRISNQLSDLAARRARRPPFGAFVPRPPGKGDRDCESPRDVPAFLPVRTCCVALGGDAPGMAINRVTDTALKGRISRREVVERDYGRQRDGSHGRHRRGADDGDFGRFGSQRRPADQALCGQANEIIRGVSPYQAQVINKFFSDSMIVPGESLFIFADRPAARCFLPPMRRESGERQADRSSPVRRLRHGSICRVMRRRSARRAKPRSRRLRASPAWRHGLHADDAGPLRRRDEHG